MIGEKINKAENNEQGSMQEEYLKSLGELKEGELVNGSVIETGCEFVFVDIGYKSEGKIPVTEFTELPKIGDTVTVLLEKKEGREGQIVVSKKKADIKGLWKELFNSFKNEKPVEGKFIRYKKGGYDVDLGHDIIAFAPISKSDIVRIDDPETIVGISSKFFIEQFSMEANGSSNKKNNIVVSRRKWLEKDIRDKQHSFFETKKVGDIVEGIVKTFTAFGAFVDLGGFDGLLHINDMSWGHASKPKDYVKKDEKISLKIINIDVENRRINLSLKHMKENPWSNFTEKYKKNDIVDGVVSKITNFGAFIEIEEGIEGLAHISELSWIKRVQHPRDILKIGDRVKTKILDFDLEQGRISLGIKQVQPNPWDTIEEKYPSGMRLKGNIKKIIASGAFIELEEGIDGFLHADDLSWTRKIKNPSGILKENTEIEVIITGVDKKGKRISLGVKQLSESPWKSLASAYSVGDEITGKISNITNFGIFVRVQGDIDGLINKSNISDTRPENPEDIFKDFKVDMEIKTVIIELNPSKQKLSLSLKDYHKKLHNEELSRYIHSEDMDKTSFGDFFKEKGDT